MPTVTALRPGRRDRVSVELDGAPWRTLPAAAVVAAGLGVGTVLDRPRARELRRALRRTAALDAAGRALARRDRSPAGLDAALERRGISGSEREAAVETLERLGYVDEQRFAESRAAALARRGFGDDAIRFDLEREGVGGEAAAAALASLEPEQKRAAALIATGNDEAKTARRLLSRGFSPETVETALAARETWA
jgi:regulatory protein